MRLGRGQTRFPVNQISAVKPAPPPTINIPVRTTLLKAHYRYISGKQFATARLSDIFVSKVNFYNFTVGLANGTRRQRKVESYLDWPQPIQTDDKSRWEIEVCKKESPC